MKKYIHISGDLRNKILAGEYQSNDKLPSEKELGLFYEASKMTVKQALDILVSEGLIIKRRGSGTFVKDLSKNEIDRIAIVNQFRGKTAENPDKKVTSKVLDFSVIKASPLIQSKLNISEGDFVYHIYRVRYLDGSPAVIEETHMPIDVIPGLKKETLEASIYEYIEEELHLKIQSGHRTITVRKATDFEAEQLFLEKGDPVGVAEQIGYLATGAAFEYSISVHRYDRFITEMILTRN
ncbi:MULTISPECIES: GntR family transcriptional regulator [Enterococcus]|uniref:GntR family transcriptional regulator n=1 Tax=Enterococcus TaxID=1350 RepID=UPI00065DC0D4|nr:MULTISPECIES: GntR family transcriptional regulator [Enterococcus]KAF1303387.1 GntR family transcriptional regulator [Enterococcus sp. JM9B]